MEQFNFDKDEVLFDVTGLIRLKPLWVESSNTGRYITTEDSKLVKAHLPLFSKNTFSSFSVSKSFTLYYLNGSVAPTLNFKGAGILYFISCKEDAPYSAGTALVLGQSEYFCLESKSYINHFLGWVNL